MCWPGRSNGLSILNQTRHEKRGVFNVNEERLKEFMANGTDAEGTPKTPFAEEKTTRETDIFPSVREDADKPLPVSREPAGSGISLPEKIQEYRKIFSTVRLPSIESRLISVMTPTVGLHGFCRCSVTA